ncbi:unnamed protein product [Withania somnifera]
MARNKMNVSLILSLSLLLCLVRIQQCHGGEGDVLLKFLEARQTKKLSKTNLNKGQVKAEKGVNSELGLIIPQKGSTEDDKISALPGQPSGVSFSQYSGYVTVDANAGRALFYYFTESTQDPSNKPLLLWLNGGMAELGPFRVNNDGITLWLDEFAWNNDYVIEDKRTSEDSYTFLINWMKRFSEYKNRKFYIAGESYAGQLRASTYTTYPCSKENRSSFCSYDFYWSHAIVSDEVHEGIVINCNFSASSLSESCYEYKNEANFSREALHVRGTPQEWVSCKPIHASRQDSPDTVLPIFQELMHSGIRVWIYRSAVEYQNLTFVTVRGSGHFVPGYQPGRAFTMFSSFINGTLPPDDEYLK